MQALHGPLWRLEKVEMHISAAAAAEPCLAELQGEVLGDKPRYRSALRQVHAQRHTQIYSTHINTSVLRQNRGPKARPASAGPAGSGVQSTLWVNGQTERVGSVRSEEVREHLLPQISANRQVLCLRAEGKREAALRLHWNMVFHKKTAALSSHCWIEFMTESLHLPQCRITYLCSAVLNIWHMR